MTEPDIETIVLDLTGAWHDEPRDWIGDVTLNEFLGLRPEEGTPFARDGINPPRLARYWRWLHAALVLDEPAPESARAASAIEAACEVAALDLELYQRTESGEAGDGMDEPYRRIARILDAAGLIDWRAVR